MRNMVEAVKAKSSAMAEEVSRLAEALEGLRDSVEILRSNLDIPDPEAEETVCPPRSLPKNLVEARAVEFESLTDRLVYLTSRLVPVMEAVKAI